jgi:hypothetical protein
MIFDEYKRFFASTNNPGEGKEAGGRVGDYEVRKHICQVFLMCCILIGPFVRYGSG